MASSGSKVGDATNSCEYGNPPLLYKRRYMSWSADRLQADQRKLGRALLRKNATLIMSLTWITQFVSATNNAALQLTRFRHVLRTCTRKCSIVNRRESDDRHLFTLPLLLKPYVLSPDWNSEHWPSTLFQNRTIYLLPNSYYLAMANRNTKLVHGTCQLVRKEGEKTIYTYLYVKCIRRIPGFGLTDW